MTNTRDKLNPGIYMIINKINNKRYIGSATRLKERWRGHRSLLKRNKHFNSHLQNAWNEYGEEQFEFKVLEEIENFTESSLTDLLIEKEEFYIQKYKSNNRIFGYNMKIKCNSSLGIKWTKEQREKLSKSKLGKYSELQQQAAKINAEKRRGKPNPATSNWWKNLPKEEKDLITKRKATTLKKINKEKLKKLGYIVSPSVQKKQKEAKIKSGFIKKVQAYNLDGSLYKIYDSYTDALNDFSESTKNSGLFERCFKTGHLFANKIWKVGEEPMTKNEYIFIREKANSNFSNCKYKRIDLNGNFIFFNTKFECAESVNVSKPNKQFNKAITKNIIYKGYYWEQIEPITGNSIYDNRVKTGNMRENPVGSLGSIMSTKNR